jgi:hypothetical protein
MTLKACPFHSQIQMPVVILESEECYLKFWIIDSLAADINKIEFIISKGGEGG